VPATVTIGTNVYGKAGVRLKGMGAFLGLDQKPSFAVKFNEYERGRKFLGCSKILLNNSLQDASFVSEVFANALFREAGLPAPRAAFATVRFNERDLGVYTLIEAVNEPFLEREFGNGEGNLYEGVAQDIDAGLDQDNGEASDQAELKAPAAAARITDATERLAALEKCLEIKKFLRFVAMEILIGHWDGYTMQRSNYRIYQNPGSGKFVLIPHGMDQTFREPDGPVWPSSSSLLVRAVLQTPEGRRMYGDELTSLATNLFQTNRLSARLDELADTLRPELTARGTNALRQWENALAAYRGRVLRRVQSIDGQLRGRLPD
jgi:spore coat protein H